MRRIMTIRFMTALLALICSTGVFAQVEWLETEHDFGAFREDDGKVTCNFRFVNKGKEPISVRSVKASCGCTTPSYTKQPIEPGDTGCIMATFNPAGRPGRFTKTLSIDIAGAGAGPRKMLTLNGVVIGSESTLMSRYPVEAGPLKLRTQLVPFGTVLKGRAKSAFVEVYNASSSPVVPEWTGVPSYVRVAGSEGSIPPGEQIVYSLTITPDSSTPYGIISDTAYIGAQGEEPLKLDLSAILEEDFSKLTPGQRQNAPVVAVDSERIDFGQIQRSGESVSRTFTIENRGKSDLLVRRVYTTDKGITVTPETGKVKKGKTMEITVSTDPAELPSEVLSARIQLITNDPEQSLVIIRAIGEVVD